MSSEEMSRSNASEVYRVGTVDYISLLRLTWFALGRYKKRWDEEWSGRYHWPSSMLADLRSYGTFSLVDLVLICLLAPIWSALRAKLSRDYFQPWGHRLQLQRRNQEKLPESCWKLLFYSFTFSWSLWSVCKREIFSDPLSIWDKYGPEMEIGWDIRVTYIVQISFYANAIHSTLFLDAWRKDSIVMLVHHGVTLILLGLSFLVRQHLAGALVLLLHDVTDVTLEFTKIQTYLKRRGGRVHRIHEWLAALGCASFAITWFIFRLYWFPLKVLYTAFYGAVVLGGAPRIPFIPIFFSLLLLLLCMNLYWFHFILVFLYKLATGQVHEVEDVREDDDEKIE